MRGSASLQVVLATPALLLIMTTVFQFALYEHASHVVTAAAQHGAAAAEREGANAAVGREAALQFLGGTDRGLLRDTEVRIDRNPVETHVAVEAKVVSLVPGLELRVHGAADGPTERFRSRTER